ncbi:hypothetical protein AB7M16_003357 [Bradyrhizobium sp. USDA 372]
MSFDASQRTDPTWPNDMASEDLDALEALAS